MTKILIDKETVELALEALESCDEGDWSTGHVIHPSYNEKSVEHAVTALRQAIEQSTEQEPVGEVEQIEIDDDGQASAWFKLHDHVNLGDLLYTSPPQPQEASQRKPLTDEQVLACLHHVDEDGISLFAFARAIEAAHGIKENT